MEVKGPFNLYELLLQQPVGPAEIEKSIALVSKCSEYRFVTTIAPVVRQKGDPGKISYLTPQEVAEAANLIKKETGDNRQPYLLRIFDPKKAIDEKLRTLEALTQHALFSYRSEACKHQFKTEIQI